MQERKNVNEVHRAEQGFNQRLAVAITRGFGTMAALYILVAWMLGWMTLATAHVWPFVNDMYPFVFLLFCSNLIQLWALPVLATGQNVLHRKSELQADAQFEDVKHISSRLDELEDKIEVQGRMIEAIYQKLGCDT